jgi:hypothetical protein
MPGTPEPLLAARGAWLAAMASHEMPWLEVTRLWLQYLELADAVRARKIRRILKHAEQGAAKTAEELFPAAMSLARSILPPQEPLYAPSHDHPRTASTPLHGGADQNLPIE